MEKVNAELKTKPEDPAEVERGKRVNLLVRLDFLGRTIDKVAPDLRMFVKLPGGYEGDTIVFLTKRKKPGQVTYPNGQSTEYQKDETFVLRPSWGDNVDIHPPIMNEFTGDAKTSLVDPIIEEAAAKGLSWEEFEDRMKRSGGKIERLYPARVKKPFSEIERDAARFLSTGVYGGRNTPYKPLNMENRPFPEQLLVGNFYFYKKPLQKGETLTQRIEETDRALNK